jgi:hypothetical protein
MVTKQKYIHSSLNVVLCFPFHVHHRIKNIFKYVLFYMYEIKIRAEESINKLLKNTLLYSIVGHTKTRKLLLTELKTKHNVIVLRYHAIQFFTQQYRQYNIPFDSTNKKNNFYSFCTCYWLARTTSGNKKKMLY